MLYFKALVLVALVLIAGLVFSPSKAHAFPNDYIIDDSVFMDSSSMTAADVWTFLNQQGSGITNINVTETQTYYPNYNRSVSAAQAIFDAAQVYGMNPRVILATMQKEESLVTDPTPSPSQLRSAMGYGCPDSAGCSDAYAGLFYQIDNGTWQLRLNRERATGNNSWWNSGIHYACPAATNYYSAGLYPGNYVTFKDDANTPFASFTIATGATASLYCYTPHAFNNYPGCPGGRGYASWQETVGNTGMCYSGSYNFYTSFVSWWGSTKAGAYNYAYVASSPSPVSLQLGEKRTTNSITIRNAGNETWYADGSVPAGKHPTRLALKNYGSTSYADTTDPAWLGTRNQIKMTPASVAPGQNATFNFTLYSPPDAMRGSELLNFVPVIDGIGFMPNIDMQMWVTTTKPTYLYQSVSGFKNTILPNEETNASVTIKNTSLLNWYADGSVPAGQHPMRLALRGYKSTSYADWYDPAWLGTRNQIKMTPASVAPGQNATFTFKMIGPFAQQTDSLYFIPVIDGVTALADTGMFTTVSTPAPIIGYSYISSISPPPTMSRGTSASASLTLKNTGNTVWRNYTKPGINTTRLMMTKPAYRASAFYNSADASWLAPSQIRLSTPTVLPGENGIFTFTWKAPTATGNYIEGFKPVIDGYAPMVDFGMQFNTTVTP